MTWDGDELLRSRRARATAQARRVAMWISGAQGNVRDVTSLRAPESDRPFS